MRVITMFCVQFRNQFSRLRKVDRHDNFSIFASETIVGLWERLTAAISGMAIGIVSVFMVVGGIVIMNIMLAVVTDQPQILEMRA
jgi:putative ABC transport system permease protein